MIDSIEMAPGAGLEQVSRPEDDRQALAASGRIGERSRVLTDEVIFRIVLAMGLSSYVPIRQVFKHARRLREAGPSSARSNLCTARLRLGVAPLSHLIEGAVRTIARRETPGAFYRDLRPEAINGTILEVHDSMANAAAFGRPSAEPLGDGAFPQPGKLGPVELGTLVQIVLAVKPRGSTLPGRGSSPVGHPLERAGDPQAFSG